MPTTEKERIRFVCGGRVMPDNQNKISSVAYQFTRGISPKGAPRISAKEFRAMLKKLGVADAKKPGWKVELPNGVSIEAKADTGSLIAAPPRKATAAKAPKKAAAPKKAPAKKQTAKARKRAAGAPAKMAPRNNPRLRAVQEGDTK